MSPNLSLAAFLLVAGAMLSLLLTAVQVRLNAVLRLTAAPRVDRWHKTPTPTSGGVAVFCAAAALYFAFCGGQRLSIAAVAAAMWAFGLFDDLVRLRPRVKLAGQCALCSCAVAGGVLFHGFSSPAVNIALSFLWLLGITNAFNLIDNMDGLCAGVTVLIGSSLFCRFAAAEDWPDAQLCLMVCAAFAGFLMLNRNPARIFMGDCGSMLAGFMLAALVLMAPLPQSPAPPLLGLVSAMAAFSYPIFDTMLVSITRKSAGRPISAGGRDHSSHRLVRLGMSEAHAVLTYWLLTAVSCVISVVLSRNAAALIIATFVLYAALGMLGIFLAGFRLRAGRPAKSPTRDSSSLADQAKPQPLTAVSR